MFAAWLLASLLIGSIAYFIEMEKVDDAVIALAATQANEFAQEGLDSEKYSIGDDLVVQVLVPLPSKAGGAACFFECVFVVDRNIIAQFRNQLWPTLGWC